MEAALRAVSRQFVRRSAALRIVVGIARNPDGARDRQATARAQGDLATFVIRSVERMITFQEFELGDCDIEVQVGDGKLKGGVCGCHQFHERNSLLNTRAATFFNLDWANKGATNYICVQCGAGAQPRSLRGDDLQCRGGADLTVNGAPL